MGSASSIPQRRSRFGYDLLGSNRSGAVDYSDPLWLICITTYACALNERQGFDLRQRNRSRSPPPRMRFCRKRLPAFYPLPRASCPIGDLGYLTEAVKEPRRTAWVRQVSSVPCISLVGARQRGCILPGGFLPAVSASVEGIGSALLRRSVAKGRQRDGGGSAALPPKRRSWRRMAAIGAERLRFRPL